MLSVKLPTYTSGLSVNGSQRQLHCYAVINLKTALVSCNHFEVTGSDFKMITAYQCCSPTNGGQDVTDTNCNPS